MPSSSYPNQSSHQIHLSSTVQQSVETSEKTRMAKDDTAPFEHRVSVSPLLRNNRNRKIGLADSKARIPMMPFQNALGWSATLHVAAPPTAWLLLILLAILLNWLMHINIWDWLTPKHEKADMVFVLVDDRHQKPPENATLRGEFNQHAGGKKRDDEEIRPPEKLGATSPSVQQQPKPETKPTPPRPMAKPQPQQQAVPPKPQPKQAQKAPEKAPPMPKPTFIPRIAMPAKAQQVPRAPQNQAPTGPIVKASAQQASQASPASNPSPIQIASHGAMSVSSAGSAGSSSRGNPQGGRGEDGVDVMADADLGFLISDLQRRIKRNWQPPRGMSSKRIEVRIVLGRDGRVVRRTITRTSGETLADEAALRAIDVSAPFKSFPPQIREDQVPIDFTFDYNVLSQRANHSSLPEL